MPVDYKRGRRPHVAAGAYEPERVQLCVQGLCSKTTAIAARKARSISARAASACASASTTRCARKALAAVNGLRLRRGRRPHPAAARGQPEMPALLAGRDLPAGGGQLLPPRRAPRPLAVEPRPALPVYVQAIAGAGAQARRDAADRRPRTASETTARLIDTSHLVLFGAVDITAPVLHELMRREIPVSWYSGSGWFLGHTIGTGHRNVELRTAQYRASFDAGFCLRFARGLVASKLRNARTLLRRNWRARKRRQRRRSAGCSAPPGATARRRAWPNCSASKAMARRSISAASRLHAAPERRRAIAAVRVREPQPPPADRPGQRDAVLLSMRCWSAN